MGQQAAPVVIAWPQAIAQCIASESDAASLSPTGASQRTAARTAARRRTGPLYAMAAPGDAPLTPPQARLFHSTSGTPRRLFSCRAITKSASESRFR